VSRRLTGVGVALICVVCGYVLWRSLFPSDAVTIRRELKRMAEAASWDRIGGAVDNLGAAGRVAGYCTRDVWLSLDAGDAGGRELKGRESVRQAVAMLRSTVGALRLELSELEVIVDASREGARVQVIVVARVDGVSDLLVQEYELRMAKEEGRWRLARAMPVRGFGM
jgi:hypothetical protein